MSRFIFASIVRYGVLLGEKPFFTCTRFTGLIKSVYSLLCHKRIIVKICFMI